MIYANLGVTILLASAFLIVICCMGVVVVMLTRHSGRKDIPSDTVILNSIYDVVARSGSEYQGLRQPSTEQKSPTKSLAQPVDDAEQIEDNAAIDNWLSI